MEWTNTSQLQWLCGASATQEGKERGAECRLGGMWRNEGGMNDGAHTALFLAGLFHQWPLGSCHSGLPPAMPPLLVTMAHLKPLHELICLDKETEITTANQQWNPCSVLPGEWLTWPTEELDEPKAGGGGPAEPLEKGKEAERLLILTQGAVGQAPLCCLSTLSKEDLWHPGHSAGNLPP